MKKKIKVSFRTFGKIGFLLVVIGFFMPIACNYNGFEIAEALNKDNTLSAILLYVLFAAAVVGVVAGILLLLKNKIKVYVDWLCLLASIGSGLALYIPRLDNKFFKPDLQTGAYVILIGWIIALAAQVISHLNKEA